MSTRSRSCPKCQASMDFRLGEFICPNCGHTEAATQPKPEQKGNGPGFRSETQWGSTGVSKNAPPKVAPPPVSGTVYTSETDHTFGRGESSPPRHHSTLQTEKHIYFGLAILGNLVNLLGAGVQVPGADVGLGVGLVGTILGALLLAYVLYGSELWPKQCCMGCTGLQLISALGSLFFINSIISGMGASGGAPFSGGFLVITTIIGIAASAWLIWILYRDVQYLK